MTTISIADENGKNWRELRGTITRFDEEIDVITASDISGHLQATRTGRGTVTITFSYINGPRDTVSDKGKSN